MKKIISLVFSVLLICAFSAPSLAVDSNEGSPVTQFSYAVFDTDGNIKSTGVTPNFSTRYSWSGVTLENGEIAVFQKTDGTNFYALKGTRVKYEFTKDRVGNIVVKFHNSFNSTATGGVVLNSTTFYGVGGTNSFVIPETPCVTGSNYYSLMIQNASSDTINITSVSLTF